MHGNTRKKKHTTNMFDLSSLKKCPMQMDYMLLLLLSVSYGSASALFEKET
jgi:hypothetical protein